MNRGVVYVAFGGPAKREMALSVAALRKHADLSVCVIGDEPIAGTLTIVQPDADPGGRWAKLRINTLSPYDLTVYLDADTRPREDVSPLFRPLEAGWDLVIAPSVNQVDTKDWLWHCADRDEVLDIWGTWPLVWQGGVFAFRKNHRTHKLFAAWLAEWLIHRDQDQAALLRALWRAPVRTWLMGWPWNATKNDARAAIRHLCGRAKR